MISRTIAALAALWLVLIVVPALVAARLLTVGGDTVVVLTDGERRRNAVFTHMNPLWNRAGCRPA